MCVYVKKECVKIHDSEMKISEINSLTNSSYLVVLFCATAGKNGEELGVDEEQIVLFVYLLYDVPNNKVRKLTICTLKLLITYCCAFVNILFKITCAGVLFFLL